MSRKLSSDTERMIAEELRLGGFQSEDDVVQTALRALAERHAIVAAIDDALDDMEAVRMQPREEFDREFRERNGIPSDA